jgi:hypothetical protein
MKRCIIFLAFTMLFFVESPAIASVMINEILSDPASGLTGDANADGVRSGTQDEFIELLNYGADEVDVSGWSLSDAVSVRHIFPSDTIISPYTFLSIFGGSAPVLPNINWQVASTGSLGLNNTGDTVSLFDAGSQLIDKVSYGSIGGNDQSFTLFPDGEAAEFVLHSSLEQSQGALFSPGTSVDSRMSIALLQEEELPSNAVVPEWPSLVYFGMGWASLLLRSKF